MPTQNEIKTNNKSFNWICNLMLSSKEETTRNKAQEAVATSETHNSDWMSLSMSCNLLKRWCLSEACDRVYYRVDYRDEQDIAREAARIRNLEGGQIIGSIGYEAWDDHGRMKDEQEKWLAENAPIDTVEEKPYSPLSLLM